MDDQRRSDHAQEAVRRGVALDSVVPADPVEMRFDRERIVQLMTNLMTRPFASLLPLLFAVSLVAPGTALADSKTTQRLEQSQKVFEAFSDLTEQTIPSWLLERAYGIIVVPQVVKAALMFGGRGGKGVMAVRNPDGSWSNPTFVTLGGINFGLQFGVQVQI